MLDLAKGLFEDTTSLEVVINKVMKQSIELIPCQSCSVLLLDKDCKPRKAEVCALGDYGIWLDMVKEIMKACVGLMKKVSEQCDVAVILSP